MNFLSPNECMICDLPPGILNIKCHPNDTAHAAVVHAYRLAESEAQRPAAVRRPVFLVLNPEDYAKSEILTAAVNDEPPDAITQYPIRAEASGLYFTMTTREYLDSVVGDAHRPIVVIDSFHQFVTSDGPKTRERALDWAIERSGLIIAIRWPRSKRSRYSA